MNINITVDEVTLDSVIDSRYVQTGEDDYRAEPMTLADIIAATVAANLREDDAYKTLRKRVLEVRDEVIREQVRPIVEAAVVMPIQRTNEYGSPMGQPVTLTELIIKETHSFLTKGDGYNRETVVQKFIREEVDRAMKKELAETVADEKAKVVAAVRAKAAELIAQAVKEGVGR